MSRTRSVSTLILFLLLSGCNTGNVQPGGGAPAAAAQPVDPQEGGTAAADPQSSDSDAGSSLGNRLDQLNGRVTLLQEQVIQLKTLLDKQAEMGQMTLTQLQQLTQAGALADAGNDTLEPGVEGQGVDAAIDQLLGVVNQLGMGGVSDPYQVATTYTAKGAWILVRYRTDTGETWLADGGSWLPLEEEAVLVPSSYRVWLTRADQDLKGYVAVRLDQQSGQTWWLNDRRWQVYE